MHYSVAAYNQIYTGAQQRELLRLEVKNEQLELTHNQLRFLDDAVPSLAEVMAFQDLDTLRAYSPNDLAALKILLAEFRRDRDIARMVENGQLHLPTAEEFVESDFNIDDDFETIP